LPERFSPGGPCVELSRFTSVTGLKPGAMIFYETKRIAKFFRWMENIFGALFEKFRTVSEEENAGENGFRK
jgi:hypothetical protein